jgi:hypothetical protein
MKKKASKKAEEQLASIFEQRAEHLSAKELKTWTAYTDRDRAIVAKLLGPGAKLLIGPRGSGKSTLLRSAFYGALEERTCFAVYVNYAHSLALEPLFHRQANALQIFRQWLLSKVVAGAREVFELVEVEPPASLRAMANGADALIRGFESGGVPTLPMEPLTPQLLGDALEQWADILGMQRCVLLMDDAAHAFSPEQQREFFEVFRGLRSRRVAGKAAVYPGITSYSPYFHVGHDAELIEVWAKPDAEFLDSMRYMTQKRLPERLRDQLKGKEDIVNLLALASFGLPRGFLNMLSQVFGIGEGVQDEAPTRRRADAAVIEHADSVRALFTTLRLQLPRFENFVEAGLQFERSAIDVLKKYNQLKSDVARKTNVVAIREPIGPKFERVLAMLEYAGVVRSEGTVSRGVKGQFRRYSVHSASIIARNALSLGKSYSIRTVVDALKSGTSHDFVRTTPAALLGADFEERCVLNLPNCTKCGMPRVAEEQRFCMKCGAQLGLASVYEELLQAKIELLPLTQNKILGIREHTKLETVQDILLDDGSQSLRKVPYIGPYWAERIRTAAEEFVSV